MTQDEIAIVTITEKVMYEEITEAAAFNFIKGKGK